MIVKVVLPTHLNDEDRECIRKIGERRRNLRAFVVSLIYFLVYAVLTLPWTLYSDYFREKGYGRTSQPVGDYIGQLGLMTFVSGLITAIFMVGVYWLIRRTGKRWWIWSGVTSVVVWRLTAAA